MENLNTLITAAIEKGYKFEAYTNVCRNRFNINESFNGGTNKSYFGFTKDGNVWYWFSQQSFETTYNEDSYVFFDHRYNTINGHKMFSFNQEWKAKKFLGLR